MVITTMTELIEFVERGSPYAVRYLLKKGITVDKILGQIMQPKLKHFQLLIDHGLTSNDIDQDVLHRVKDRDCMNFIAEFVDDEILFKVLLNCHGLRFYDIIIKHLHRLKSGYKMCFRAFMPESDSDTIINKIERAILFRRELPRIHDDNARDAIDYAIMYQNYEVLHKLHIIWPSIVMDTILHWYDGDFPIDIPDKYLDYLSSDTIYENWATLSKNELIVFIYNEWLHKTLYFSYCMMSTTYRELREIRAPSNIDYYYVILNMGDQIFDDLTSDQIFLMNLAIYYPRYLIAACVARADKLTNWIVNDSWIINRAIRDLSSSQMFLYHNTISVADSQRFSLIPFFMHMIDKGVPIKLLFDQIWFFNQTPVGISEFYGWGNNIWVLGIRSQQIFQWRHRKAGIKRYAVQILAFMVLYSDEYICIGDSNSAVRRFFEIVKKMPFVIQSIIAHRYAWLPNCEPIRMKNVYFLHALSTFEN